MELEFGTGSWILDIGRSTPARPGKGLEQRWKEQLCASSAGQSRHTHTRLDAIRSLDYTCTMLEETGPSLGDDTKLER